MASAGGAMQLKVLFVGDVDVGKTSIFELYRTHEVAKSPKHTMDPVIKSFNIVTMTPHTTVELHLYDTGGQERYKTLTKQFFRDADIALLVFSITDGDSFRHIEQDWRQEVLNHNEKDVMMILIGNKDDLHEERINPKSTSRQYAEIHHMKFVEMSANRRDDYDKVDSVIREATTEIVRQRRNTMSGPVQQEDERIVLDEPVHDGLVQQQEQKRSRCRYC
ncbi:PREDICTED: ras-related protein RABF1-like isoform X2 [Amphimedon queenslandica]|uniref:Uncharacterized protein n=1 Tax=Amphimedon queenslandica TaxID=400682 RepID=A0AAN0IMM0_AMPQE|nr:PREDICTED: ras-related protein RABF1-like isoform X2 [Amphimedon queenslandica]|eukprot:XP_011403984.1 PREDICTED: ras-related protein RABF1-like isoform X2 [Amphimedon queenslandica]